MENYEIICVHIWCRFMLILNVTFWGTLYSVRKVQLPLPLPSPAGHSNSIPCLFYHYLSHQAGLSSFESLLWEVCFIQLRQVWLSTYRKQVFVWSIMLWLLESQAQILEGVHWCNFKGWDNFIEVCVYGNKKKKSTAINVDNNSREWGRGEKQSNKAPFGRNMEEGPVTF